MGKKTKKELEGEIAAANRIRAGIRFLLERYHPYPLTGEKCPYGSNCPDCMMLAGLPDIS